MLGGAGGGGGGGFNWEPVGEKSELDNNSRTNWWYGATPAIDMGDTVFLENELLAVTVDGGNIFWVWPGHELNQLVSDDLKPIKNSSARNTAIQFAYLSSTVYYCGRTADDELVFGTSNFSLSGDVQLWRTNSQIIVPA